MRGPLCWQAIRPGAGGGTHSARKGMGWLALAELHSAKRRLPAKAAGIPSACRRWFPHDMSCQ
jgi:hypothetical protein